MISATTACVRWPMAASARCGGGSGIGRSCGRWRRCMQGAPKTSVRNWPLTAKPGMVARAISFYTQAAAVAQRRHADSEAAALVRGALAVCHELPPGRSRDTQELGLLETLGNVLMIAHGYASAELGQ